ncbi:glycosyl hydrolase family 92-domain-containing protein [Schizophyllum amplum]|uniref:Glycosyl hydrolase family 92-domain-containing protein n=1 Tax=Schizophyllum amplum TaxID=97359 RepID=A0A550CKA6_9AGAR|nr:glycosyl hydrolase family 92-domain-containing protein [Auriculariopsis ampla]
MRWNPLTMQVLPFIGSVNGGHVFPGATVPHGMVKAGMDTDSPGNAVPLSNFKLWPIAFCPDGFRSCNVSMANRKMLRKTLEDGTPDDYATPGYFASNLSSDVRIELTATRRAALHRYTFPANTTEPRILVDITNDGMQSSTDVQGSVDPLSGRVVGGAQFASSFGQDRYYAFTCVDWRGDGYELGTPTEYGTWLSNYATYGTVDVHQTYFGFASEMGAMLTWPSNSAGETTILARVGVSLISSEQACQNAEEEIPDFDFDRVYSESRAQWNELLGRFQVDKTGVSEDTLQLFYSSLYRTHIAPADYTGENPKWESTEPYYDSLYCNWDTYRTLFPLWTMHDPYTMAEVVRGMIDIQKHEEFALNSLTGWLPECRSSTTKQYIQGGSHADPILAEFYVKLQEHVSALEVSADDLYAALLADAEDQSPNWNVQGREVNAWKEYNYIPQFFFAPGGANTKWVSRTVEYAFDDFTIAQVAQAMNKTEDAAKYYARAGNYANVWNSNVTFPGREDIKGMMQPRFQDGIFNYTDPRHCSIHDPEKATCFLNAVRRDGFYESSPMVYVPQDTAKLIEMQGGIEAFVNRLDFIFDEGYFDSTNEPSQQIPFMYHYANMPAKSTQRAREVISQSFNTSLNGLPGNDDAGAMGSYVVFYMLGLYPLPATKQVLLSSPYFPEITIYNPLFGTNTTIRSTNWAENGTVYVKSVAVDGEAYKSNCYLDWDVFVKGSTVELELTDTMDATCGDGPGALPPSLSTGGYSN